MIIITGKTHNGHISWLSTCLPRAHQSMALLCPAPVIISWNQVFYENFEKKLVYKILFTIMIILVADLICNNAISCC